MEKITLYHGFQVKTTPDAYENEADKATRLKYTFDILAGITGMRPESGRHSGKERQGAYLATRDFYALAYAGTGIDFDLYGLSVMLEFDCDPHDFSFNPDYQMSGSSLPLKKIVFPMQAELSQLQQLGVLENELSRRLRDFPKWVRADGDFFINKVNVNPHQINVEISFPGLGLKAITHLQTQKDDKSFDHIEIKSTRSADQVPQIIDHDHPLHSLKRYVDANLTEEFCSVLRDYFPEKYRQHFNIADYSAVKFIQAGEELLPDRVFLLNALSQRITVNRDLVEKKDWDGIAHSAGHHAFTPEGRHKNLWDDLGME